MERDAVLLGRGGDGEGVPLKARDGGAADVGVLALGVLGQRAGLGDDEGEHGVGHERGRDDVDGLAGGNLTVDALAEVDDAGTDEELPVVGADHVLAVDEREHEERHVEHVRNPEDLEVPALDVDVRGRVDSEDDEHEQDARDPDARAEGVPHQLRLLHVVEEVRDGVANRGGEGRPGDELVELDGVIDGEEPEDAADDVRIPRARARVVDEPADDAVRDGDEDDRVVEVHHAAEELGHADPVGHVLLVGHGGDFRVALVVVVKVLDGLDRVIGVLGVEGTDDNVGRDVGNQEHDAAHLLVGVAAAEERQAARAAREALHDVLTGLARRRLARRQRRAVELAEVGRVEVRNSRDEKRTCADRGGQRETAGHAGEHVEDAAPGHTGDAAARLAVADLVEQDAEAAEEGEEADARVEDVERGGRGVVVVDGRGGKAPGAPEQQPEARKAVEGAGHHGRVVGVEPNERLAAAHVVVAAEADVGADGRGRVGRGRD